MHKFIKKLNIKKSFTWVLVIMISIAFIVMMTDNPFGGYSNIIGSVNGKKIRNTRESLFAKYYNMLIDRYGGGRDNEQLLDYIKSMAFNEAAFAELLKSYIEKNKIFISADDIRNVVRQRYFVNQETGEFQEQNYMQFLQSGTKTQKDSLQKESHEMLSRHVLFDITLFPFFPVSVYELNEITAASRNRKAAAAAYIDCSEHITAYVSEKDLYPYFTENKTNYKSETGTEADEVLYKKQFEHVRADFINQHFAVLLNTAKNDIRKKIQSSVNDGSFRNNFEKAAKTAGMTIFHTGYFSLFSQEITDSEGKAIPGIPAKEIIDALLFLKKGDISPVVETEHGLVIGLVTGEEMPQGDAPSFAYQKMLQTATEERLTAYQQAFRGFLFQAADIKFNLQSGGN